MDKLRVIAQEAIDLHGGGGLSLTGRLFGFEPRLIIFNVILALKIRHYGEAAMPQGSAARASTRRIIAYYTRPFALHLRGKSRKNLNQGS